MDLDKATFTVGNRTYESISFLRKDEESVSGHIMTKRADEMNAKLGKDDGQYLLDNQHLLPSTLQGKVLVFPSWIHPNPPDSVKCIIYPHNQWVWDWFLLDYLWDKERILLRRK
jgi:hypothetical protein